MGIGIGSEVDVNSFKLFKIPNIIPAIIISNHQENVRLLATHKLSTHHQHHPHQHTVAGGDVVWHDPNDARGHHNSNFQTFKFLLENHDRKLNFMVAKISTRYN